MNLPINKILQAHKEGRPSYGIYMRTAVPKMVEMMAGADLDFVRIDLELANINLENLENMIKTAHLCGITPTVRVNDNDENLIQRILNMGALGIIIPEVRGYEDVLYASKALNLHPDGSRYAGPTTWLGGYNSISGEEYVNWARENTFLSVQIEHTSAIDELDEILSIPGLKMIQSGRGTLSHDLNAKSQYDPEVVELEKKVMKKAIAAGKLTSVQYYPMLRDEDVQTIKDYVAMGVNSISIGTDIDLVASFRNTLKELKA